MSTLEELLEQKKQIEQQIKILKNQECMYGNAKLGMNHYPRGDEYYIAVKTVVDEDLSQSRWRAIITMKTKEEAIKSIDSILHDLERLKDVLTKEADYDTEGN